MDDETLEGFFEKESDEEEWGLVLAFDSDHPEFTRGFACGMIWQLMEQGERVIHATVMSDNLHMCWEMASVRDYDISGVETGSAEMSSGLTDAVWMELTFTKRPDAPVV